MEITFATAASPNAAVNEDLVLAGQSWAVVLDGATASSRANGCIHTVRWYVEHLGSALASRLIRDAGLGLPDLVASAIEAVNWQHADTCDLSNPSSPSSTAVVLRVRSGAVDYLALADSPLVLKGTTGDVRPIVDDRTDRLPSYTPDAVERLRNTPEGFWVASTNPEAAHHALFGSIPECDLSAVALMTDGVSRLVTGFGLTWDDVMTRLLERGPAAVIDEVRTKERSQPLAWRGGKAHDDATIALVRMMTKDGAR